jgi:hypothetical protein
MQTLLKPEILSEEVKKDLDIIITTAAIAVINVKTNPNDDALNQSHSPDILESVREANKVSPLLDEFRKQTSKPDNTYNLRDNYLFFEDRLVIPDEGRLHIKLINHIHRQPAVGHSDRNRILELIKDRFYWPRQRKTVKRYIRNYHDCRRAKALIEKYQRLLRPLPIPERL